MFRMLILLTALAGASGPAAAMEKYICVGDKSTGFRWDGKAWGMAKFNVSTDRYLIEEIKPETVFSQTFNFHVKKFGSDKIEHRCERATMGNGEKWPVIVCGGLGYGLMMNTTTLRYQETYGLGYVDGTDDENNTPSMTIGTCTKLE